MVLRMESTSGQRHKGASLPHAMIVAVLLLLSMFSVPFTPLTNGLSTAASPQPPAQVGAHPESHPDCVGCSFITAWGCQNAATQACTPGAGLGHFLYPGGVAVDSSGNPSVYVIDIDNKRVQKFDSSGNNPYEWGCSTYASTVPACPASTAVGQFNGPLGVAVDSSGTIVYVADTWNDRVEKFTSSGGPTSPSVLGAGVGTGDGQFSPSYPLSGNPASGPTWVAVDPSGNVYVADTGNNRVEKFSSSGSFSGWAGGCTSGSNCVSGTSNGFSCTLATCGAPLAGSGNGQFNVPNGVAVDPVSGNVYVVDSSNYRVQKFTSSGSFITAWGSQGSGNGHFIGPLGVAVDPVHGDVYVTDFDYTGNSRVEKFDSSGNPSPPLMWGSGGQGSSQFNMPFGIAVDSSGCVYVADYGNHRVQKFGDSPSCGTPPPTTTSCFPLSSDLAQHLVAWWHLDEVTGATQINDVAGYNNLGTPKPLGMVGTPNGPSHVVGQVNGALSFTSGFYVDVPDQAELNFGAGTDFSIDAWVRIAQASPTSIQPIVDKISLVSSPIFGYSFYIQGQQLHLTIGDGAYATFIDPTTIPFNTWTHVAVTIQKIATGPVKFYVNSVQFSLTGGESSSTASNFNALSLFIGQSRLPGGRGDIDIDELELFNRTLTQPEVQGIYGAGVAGKCPLTPGTPGITVAPGTATNPVGSSHTVTATVLDNAGAPLVGVTVTFKVTSGPNVGQTGTCVTNSLGQCSFTYSGTGGAGTDNIVATFTDASGTLHSSNIVAKTWQTTITSTTCTSSTTITGTSTLNLPFVSKTTWTNTTCAGCMITSTVTHIVPYSPPWTNVGLIQWLVVIATIAMAVSYIVLKRVRFKVQNKDT